MRIEAQFRAAQARAPLRLVCEGFALTSWGNVHVFYRDAAFPLRRPGDWCVAVVSLGEVARRRGLRPRLEFVEELWPDLAATLSELGGLERLPLMALERLPQAPSRQGDGSILLTADNAPLQVAYLTGLAATFGEEAFSEAECRRLALELALGCIRIAVAVQGHRVIAGASLLVAGGAAELAGVWADPAHRGRGHGDDLCRRLLFDFLRERESGLVWTALGDEALSPFYEALGFVPVGTRCLAIPGC